MCEAPRRVRELCRRGEREGERVLGVLWWGCLGGGGMSEPDPLFRLKNDFFLGNFSSAVNEAQGVILTTAQQRELRCRPRGGRDLTRRAGTSFCTGPSSACATTPLL